MEMTYYPKIFDLIFPKRIWRINNAEAIFLTFDDGPIPEVTPWVLDELDKVNAKATFFCVGENAVKNKSIIHEILKRGHKLGNHTYNHVNAAKVKPEYYLENYKKGKEVLENISGQSIKLFRPPYGRLSGYLAKEILKEDKIVMWSILSKDYDLNQKSADILEKCMKYTEPGVIILFHDSLKAEANLREILPEYLDFLRNKGLIFSILN